MYYTVLYYTTLFCIILHYTTLYLLILDVKIQRLPGSPTLKCIRSDDAAIGGALLQHEAE